MRDAEAAGFDLPVWKTERGGFVRRDPNEPRRHIFVMAPKDEQFRVGDIMPERWAISAANELAENLVKAELVAKKAAQTADGRAVADTKIAQAICA